jgi:hypothetical protein
MTRNPRYDPGLDSELPAAGKRCPRNDNIRFRLPSKNLAQGNLGQRRDPLKKSGSSLLPLNILAEALPLSWSHYVLLISRSRSDEVRQF